MLQVHQLGCKRGEAWLWQNINFELPSGKLLQITGPNGCGKTSLLRILSGLMPASAGVVRWGDTAITRSYVGHQPAVKNELTVSENLCLLGRKIALQLQTEVLEAVGLNHYSDHFGYQLSQGQKQRVALARLLLNSSRLWILDEPFAGLDVDMIEAMQCLFAKHLQAGGLLALTTHRPLSSAALTEHMLPLDLSRFQVSGN